MIPPIPTAGLDHVLSAWNGHGQLLEAMAAAADADPIERKWTARDIRRRAHRVLFAELLPAVARLPVSARQWHRALPGESTSQRCLQTVATGTVDIVRTRLRGWPPDAFVVRQRGRGADELLARTTSWTLRGLQEVAKDALAVEPLLGPPVERQLAAIGAALASTSLAFSAAERPDRLSLAATRHAGRPWTAVASIAGRLRNLEEDVATFARQLIEPDERLRWRLFHLAVLGEVLLALLGADYRVESLSPLSASAAGANYRAVHTSRGSLDIWFEGAGIWKAMSGRSPYVSATAGLRGAGTRPLGPDILLVAGRRVLVLECKYSAAGSYVATGYEQALAYAAELLGPLAETVDSAVIGPDGVVTEAAESTTGVGSIRVLPATGVDGLVRSWISGERSDYAVTP